MTNNTDDSPNFAQRILSKSTPITTALALALCAGAFWIGKTTQHIESEIYKETEIRKLQNEQTTKILDRLTQISEENSRLIKNLVKANN